MGVDEVGVVDGLVDCGRLSLSSAGRRGTIIPAATT